MPPTGVAFVTGASYGLGSHIAKQLAAAKWEVVLVARSREKLREVQAEIAQENGISLVLEADITDKNAVANLMKKTSEAFPGGVDILVNNAAYVAPVHKFVEADMTEWERMVAVNVWGALDMTRAFLPGMVEKKKGKIIFISSKAGVNPSPGLAVHSGTKHMVEAVAKALRQEVAGTGVTGGVVRPGGVNTPGYQHATGRIGKHGIGVGSVFRSEARLRAVGWAPQNFWVNSLPYFCWCTSLSSNPGGLVQSLLLQRGTLLVL